jgi:hypothetical protein
MDIISLWCIETDVGRRDARAYNSILALAVELLSFPLHMVENLKFIEGFDWIKCSKPALEMFFI